MNFKIKLIIWIALFALLFIGLLPGESQSEKEQDRKNKIYSVGPKDLLTINVFDVPDLNITVRVSEDGTINLPLLGNVKVEGLTRFQLENHLAQLLEKNYLRNPQVTVFIKEYQSKKVSVIGAVKNPGNYELVGNQSLLELISIAGGLTEKASDRVVMIRKNEDGKSNSQVIDLDELMMKGDPKLNLPLQAGDIINIPGERFFDIYVFGQVKQPGHMKVKKDGDITLLRAIAQAGGFSDRARKTAVLVKRKVNGVEKKIRINVKKILRGKIPDFVLEDNDIIHVPESVL